jgi:hypothetical protein
MLAELEKAKEKEIYRPLLRSLAARCQYVHSLGYLLVVINLPHHP